MVMERFKKRTLALVLASVVTVVGTFASSNYKNSLMGLSFESSASGDINMIVETKRAYTGNVTPVKKDANTYVLMLPEMNSEASTPDLQKVSGNIASVNIRTMPYSNTAKGYTRITIKTLTPSMNLFATNKIFVSSNETRRIETTIPTQTTYKPQPEIKNTQEDNDIHNTHYTNQPETGPNEVLKQSVPTQVEEVPQTKPEEPNLEQDNYETTTDPPSNNAYLFLWAMLIVLASAFFYMRAQSKMQEIAGERLDINIEDSDKTQKEEKENKKRKSIRKTINSLDSAYSKTAVMPGRINVLAGKKPVKFTKPVEDTQIVDLDALFQEHKSKTKEEEENEALEEFLSGFSFDEPEEVIEENTFNEEFYQDIINNHSLKFNKDDINCINKLLGTEISDDTMRDIEKYAVSNPISKPSKIKLLESMVSDYAISQNIIFEKEDVDILYKLMTVEFDKDFITDLRTNPENTIRMEKDILEYGDKPKKPSEIVILSVKDMLPDLSDALKKQGSKQIEYNHRAETIYYSEGYEVKTLSLKDSLPDLSKEIKKSTTFNSKPSAEFQVVDTSYSVGDNVLKISSDLPDLQDAFANPEKYAKPEKKEVVVDANALLQNISNVQFKPFYDGTTEFEVINEIPSISDVQAELNQFAGFEVTEEEQIINPSIQEERDDFSELYNNEYVDLDSPKENKTEVNHIQKTQFSPTAELMKKIEITKQERELRRAKITQNRIEQKAPIFQKPQESKTSTSIKCILDGESYNVVSSVNFDENKGCHLAKNENGYTVLGFIGDKLIKIQSYDNLKSEKIQARFSEKLEDETSRYIIRIGLKKFVVNVIENDIQYVMDLC